jgi:hypothetical protein
MKIGRSMPQRFGRFSDFDKQFPRLQRLEGFYYYDRYQQDILLLGYFDEQGNITISEYATPGKPPTGVFKGSLAGSRFQGRWESPDGKRSVEFELTEVRKQLRTTQEAERISRRDEELAAQSTNDKDFTKTIFYLTLSRLEPATVSTNHTLNDPKKTQNLGSALSGSIGGKARGVQGEPCVLPKRIVLPELCTESS